MESEKRYKHFAIDETGKIINIHNVTERSRIYKCPYCNHEMIPKMGKIRDWHFAHKHNTDDCDYDKYLHTLAEQLIYNWLTTAKNVPLRLNSTEKCNHYKECPLKDDEFCSKEVLLQAINLNHWIDSWNLERGLKKNGHEFIADIFGHNKNKEDNPIFIEIYVTHQCEKEKIESGIKIIEFKIDNEQDIINIINHPIIAEENKTIFYNFHPEEKVGLWKDFSLSLKRFVLFPSGKAYIKNITCHEYNIRQGVFEFTLPVSPEEEDMPIMFNDELWSPSALIFPLGYILAHKVFPNTKHCHICRWHAKTFTMEHICKLYKRYNTNKYCSENDATKCPYFQIDSELEVQMTNLYNIIKANMHAGVWKRDIKNK